MVTAGELMLKFSTQGDDQAAAAARKVGGEVANADKKTQGFGKTMLSTAGGMVLGNAVGQLGSRLVSLGGSFLMANANAETYRNSLNVAVGDSNKAGVIFKQLQNFAKDTPFEFPELVQTATRLEALGVSSQKYIGTLGDVAAGTGTTISQVSEAFLDASVGEFERLKEYGIQSKVVGDQIQFSYMKNGKMVQQSVERGNQEMIQSTLAAIWNDKYKGAMEVQSRTFNGQWSTLKDNVNLAMQGATKGIFNFAKSGLEAANTFFGEFGRLREKGLGVVPAIFEGLRDTVSKTFGKETAASINSWITTAEGLFGTLSSAVGSVVSAIGSGLGLLKDNLGIVLPALLGVGAALLGLMAGAAVVGVFGAIAAAIAFLLSPVGLLIAACALLGAAWANNWFGIRDVVSSVVSSVMGYLGPLINYLKKVWTSANTFNSAFKSLPKSIQPVAHAIGVVVDAFADLYRTFSRDGLSGLLRELPGELKQIGEGFLELFGALAPIIGDGIRAVVGKIEGFLGDLVPLVSAKIGEAFGPKMQALFNGFAQGFAILWDGIKTQVETVVAIISALLDGDLKGAFNALLSGLVASFTTMGQLILNAVTNILPPLVSLLADAGRAMFDALKGVDWGGVFDDLVEAGSNLVGRLGDLAGQLWSWLQDQISQVPWGDALHAAGDLLVAGLRAGWDLAIEGFKTVIREAPDALGKLITGAGDVLKPVGELLVKGLRAGWDLAVEGFKAVMRELPGALGGLVTNADNVLKPIGQALVTGLRAGWDLAVESFKSVMSALPGALVALITGAGEALKPIGELLVAGLRAGWDLAVESFKSVMTALPGALVALITGAPDALKPIGQALVDGLRAGWDLAIEGFKSVMSQLPGALAALVTNAGDVLKPVGQALVAGLKAGWGLAIEGVKAIVREAPGALAALITGADKVLEPAGRLLVAGLKAGWSAAIEEVKSIVRELPGALAGLVTNAGDALKPVGEALVAGLKAGWTAAIEGVKTIVTNAPGELANLMKGALTGVDWSGVGKQIVDGIWNAMKSAASGLNPMDLFFGGGGGGSGQEPVHKGPYGEPTEEGATPVARGGGGLRFGSSSRMSLDGLLGGSGGSGGIPAPDFSGWVAAAQAAVQAVSGVLSGFVSIMGQFGTAAGAAYNTALAGALAPVTATTQAMVQGGAAVLGGNVAIMGQFGTAGGAAYTTALTGALAPVTGTVQAMVQGASAVLSGFVSIAGQFGTAAGNGFNTNLKPGLTSAGAAIGQFVNDATNKLSNFASQAASRGAEAGNSFRDRVSSAFSSAASSVSSHLSNMGSRLSSCASQAANAGSQAGSGFANGAEGGFRRAVSAAHSAASDIQGALSGLNLYSYGANAGSSLAAGMESQLGRIQAAAAAMAAAVNAATAAGLRAASPSKTMVQRGAWAGQGLVLGLRDMIPAVARAGLDLARAAMATPDLSTLTPAVALAGTAGAGAGPAASSFNSEPKRIVLEFGDITIEAKHDPEEIANLAGAEATRRVFAALTGSQPLVKPLAVARS